MIRISPSAYTKYLIWLLLFLYSLNSYAQNQHITGIITDAQDNPVPYANIMIKGANNLITSFNSSNSKGKYLLSLTDSITFDGLYIEVNLLGYKKNTTPLTRGLYIYNFKLEVEPINLQEVTIKNKRQIVKIGDTLSYDVSAFAKEEDRSIGDVIRRLPGITVSDNGQISFNGKIISNLYIQNDDLMDGRYGLATKAIRKDMIKKIEVIQNHQPVKVLRNKVFTEDIAMNLVLKDENSLNLAGQVMAGTGVPKNADLALNAMILNKHIKTLNALKGNNVGVDLSNDFSKLNTTTQFGENMGAKKAQQFLNTGFSGSPDIPKSNYYFNRSVLLNTNDLINLKGDLQLKTNLQFFKDLNTNDYQVNIDNLLSNEIIRYNEQQHISRDLDLINLSFNATINRTNMFMNNKLTTELSKTLTSTNANFNDHLFKQELSQKIRSFVNEFRYTPALKNNNILEIRWNLSQQANPEYLNVDNGINIHSLVPDGKFASGKQFLKFPNFSSNISLSYIPTKDSIIRHNYHLQVTNERQQLNSMLKIMDLDQSNPYTEYENKIMWSLNRATFSADYLLKRQNWDFGLNIPISVQKIQYTQVEPITISKQIFFLNPRMRFKVPFNPEDFISANYSFSNDFGNISNIYRNIILTSFRAVNSNSDQLQEHQIHSFNLQYNLQRTIVMFFSNLNLDYRNISSNTLIANIITDKGQSTYLLNQKNDQQNLSISTNLSKFIFFLNSTITIKSSWQRTSYSQLINENSIPFKYDLFSISSGFDTKLFNAFVINYNGTGNWISNKQNIAIQNGIQLSSKNRRLDQQLSLGLSLSDKLFSKIISKSILSTQNSSNNINVFFLDLSTRYKINKWRTDLQLDVTNIFNIKKYNNISISANQIVESSFNIRGRMAVVRATFNL